MKPPFNSEQLPEIRDYLRREAATYFTNDAQSALEFVLLELRKETEAARVRVPTDLCFPPEPFDRPCRHCGAFP